VRRPGRSSPCRTTTCPPRPNARADRRPGEREQIEALRRNALGRASPSTTSRTPVKGSSTSSAPRRGSSSRGSPSSAATPHRDAGRLRRHRLRHRHLRGGARPRHPDALAEDAPQMRVSVTGALRPLVTPKDVILAVIAKIGAPAVRIRHRVLGGHDPADVDGGADDGVQHDDRGGGPLRLIAPDGITFAYLEGRPLAPPPGQWDAAVSCWKGLPSTRTPRGTARWRWTRPP